MFASSLRVILPDMRQTKTRFNPLLMHNSPSRKIKLFVFFAIVILGLGMAVVYLAGFGQMAAKASLQPERLRDFTFPVWHKYPLTKHGFLTFLDADGYAKQQAYANESTIYLWIMWVLYRIELVFPSASMRLTNAFLAMATTLLAIGCAIRKPTWEKLDLRGGVLLLAAFCYFLTTPIFWISLGKFNVDNVFVLNLPVFVLASAFLVRDGAHGLRFWLVAVVMCLLVPVNAALFGAFMGLRAILSRRLAARMLRSSIVMTTIAVVVYLQPVIVARLLHFTSENSTWLFRSGLDGDMRFYGNFIDSVLAPQFNRPMYFVLIPAALLVLQLWYRRKFALAVHGPNERYGQSDDSMMSYLFCSYFLTLLFWPQAVSIHPYLYDQILIGPIGVWVVLNFAMPDVHERHYLGWLFLLLFLITLNVTKIAQAAHCVGCYFPPWGMQGPRGG